MTTLKGGIENIKVKYIWVSNGGCDACEEAMAAYDIFVSNKAEMEEFRGYDKYYHAKANCEATQLGKIG